MNRPEALVLLALITVGCVPLAGVALHARREMRLAKLLRAEDPPPLVF